MFIKDKIQKRIGYFYAVCSHINPYIALSRTVTEALQIFPKFSDKKKWLNKKINHYFRLSNHSISMQSIKSFTSQDIKKNILYCLKKLKKLNFEVLIVNLSTPGCDFPVVHVIILGFQPPWYKEIPILTDRVFYLPEKLRFVP